MVYGLIRVDLRKSCTYRLRAIKCSFLTSIKIKKINAAIFLTKNSDNLNLYRLCRVQL